RRGREPQRPEGERRVLLQHVGPLRERLRGQEQAREEQPLRHQAPPRPARPLATARPEGRRRTAGRPSSIRALCRRGTCRAVTLLPLPAFLPRSRAFIRSARVLFPSSSPFPICPRLRPCSRLSRTVTPAPGRERTSRARAPAQLPHRPAPRPHG